MAFRNILRNLSNQSINTRHNYERILCQLFQLQLIVKHTNFTTWIFPANLTSVTPGCLHFFNHGCIYLYDLFVKNTGKKVSLFVQSIFNGIHCK